MLIVSVVLAKFPSVFSILICFSCFPLIVHVCPKFVQHVAAGFGSRRSVSSSRGVWRAVTGHRLIHQVTGTSKLGTRDQILWKTKWNWENPWKNQVCSGSTDWSLLKPAECVHLNLKCDQQTWSWYSRQIECWFFTSASTPQPRPSAVRLEGWIKRKDEHCKTIASLLLNLFEAHCQLSHGRWDPGLAFEVPVKHSDMSDMPVKFSENPKNEVNRHG